MRAVFMGSFNSIIWDEHCYYCFFSRMIMGIFTVPWDLNDLSCGFNLVVNMTTNHLHGKQNSEYWVGKENLIAKAQYSINSSDCVAIFLSVDSEYSRNQRTTMSFYWRKSWVQVIIWWSFEKYNHDISFEIGCCLQNDAIMVFDEKNR